MPMTQKSRAWVSLGVLLTLACGAGLLAWLAEEEREQQKALDEQQARLLDVDTAKIQGLTVTAKGQTTVLAATKDRWEVVSPVRAPADAQAVATLLEQLVELKRKTVVDDKGAQLAAYGLDKPSVKLSLRLEGGAERTLRLGTSNAFDGSFYASLGDSSEVLQVQGGKWAIEKDTFDLRDKQLLRFEDTQVASLDVKLDGVRYSLRRQGGVWKMVSPVSATADANVVTRLLGNLRGLRALRFVTDLATPLDNETYGLVSPRLEATVTYEDQGGFTLLAGQAQIDGRKKAFARLRDRANIAEIQDLIFTDLDVEPSTLEDKTLLVVERDKVVELELRWGEDRTVLKRVSAPDGGVGDDWEVTSPKPGKTFRAKVQNLLSALSSLKGSRLVDPASERATSALAAPGRSIVLRGAGGVELGGLVIGTESGGFAVVRSTSSGKVFEVESNRLADLPSSSSEFDVGSQGG